MTCCNFLNCLKVANFVMVNQGEQENGFAWFLQTKTKIIEYISKTFIQVSL